MTILNCLDESGSVNILIDTKYVLRAMQHGKETWDTTGTRTTGRIAQFHIEMDAKRHCVERCLKNWRHTMHRVYVIFYGCIKDFAKPEQSVRHRFCYRWKLAWMKQFKILSIHSTEGRLHKTVFMSKNNEYAQIALINLKWRDGVSSRKNVIQA